MSTFSEVVRKKKKTTQEKKVRATSPLVRMWSPTILLSEAQCCLTDEIGQDHVLPAWYEGN